MALFDSARLGRTDGVEMSVVGYRNQSAGFDARSGEGARRNGGRFNPPHSFPVIYLCTTRPCVVAELTRQARRQNVGVDDLLPRELWKLSAELTKVLDLTNESTLKSLDIDLVEITRDDLQLTREIGESAHEHGFQGILSASAIGVDKVISILPEKLAGAVFVAELVEVWNSASDVR